jgi:hypothetical protein
VNWRDTIRAHSPALAESPRGCNTPRGHSVLGVLKQHEGVFALPAGACKQCTQVVEGRGVLSESVFLGRVCFLGRVRRVVQPIVACFKAVMAPSVLELLFGQLKSVIHFESVSAAGVSLECPVHILFLVSAVLCREIGPGFC